MRTPTVFSLPASWVAPEDVVPGSEEIPCARCGIILLASPASLGILREAKVLRLDIPIVCLGHAHQIDKEAQELVDDDGPVIVSDPQEFIELARLEASFNAPDADDSVVDGG